MTQQPHRPRRALTALLLLTVLVMGLDVAGGPGPGLLRAGGGAVFGPVERLVDRVAGAAPAGVAPVRDGVDRAVLHQRAAVGRALDSLVAGSAGAGHDVLPARVVAVGRQGPGGPERVTVDVGSRDGVRPGLGVVSAAGVVGRVAAVAPWTCDVLLVGSPDLTVGVRVGATGVLGSVTSGARGGHPRPAGQLGLTVVQRGQLAPGDAVTTLGSAGGVPFPAGLRVGEVAAVDPAAGVLAPGAGVRPAVDPTRLDVVGVLVGPSRATPRAVLTGAG
jgi:rod shape-determining protein MreC